MKLFHLNLVLVQCFYFCSSTSPTADRQNFLFVGVFFFFCRFEGNKIDRFTSPQPFNVLKLSVLLNAARPQRCVHPQAHNSGASSLPLVLTLEEAPPPGPGSAGLVLSSSCPGCSSGWCTTWLVWLKPHSRKAFQRSRTRSIHEGEFSRKYRKDQKNLVSCSRLTRKTQVSICRLLAKRLQGF